jgi:hypothetical protein
MTRITETHAAKPEQDTLFQELVHQHHDTLVDPFSQISKTFLIYLLDTRPERAYGHRQGYCCH